MNPSIVEARKDERGIWSVYVRGNWMSSHATHEAARLVAQQMLLVEQAS